MVKLMNIINFKGASLITRWTRLQSIFISTVVILLLYLYFQGTNVPFLLIQRRGVRKPILPSPRFPAKVTKLFPELKSKHSRYLRLTNTIYDSVGVERVPRNTTRILEDIIRSGLGLQPFKTERGEDAWVENGIVHRPRRTGGYTPEFESYVPFDRYMFFEGRKPDPRMRREKKIILWYLAPSFVPPSPGLRPLDACPEFPCVITTDQKSYEDTSSASIFAANEIRLSMPPNRSSSDQVYILHNHEAPNFLNQDGTTRIKEQPWRRAFNWTLSFRSDSDIIVPYAIVRRRPGKLPLEKDYRHIVDMKSKMAAWAVNHCTSVSGRERYAEALGQHVDVEIIGACGKEQCPQSNRDLCTDQISKKYKFYLAFENALSPDYITEKLFLYLQRDIVIVARGSNEYYKHLPPEIFINTNDFDSPKDLARKLNYLDKNEEAYIRILREKDKYVTMMEDRGIVQLNEMTFHNNYVYDNVPLCLLCQRLWNLDAYRKEIKDAYQWLLKGRCRAPQDIE